MKAKQTAKMTAEEFKQNMPEVHSGANYIIKGSNSSEEALLNVCNYYTDAGNTLAGCGENKEDHALTCTFADGTVAKYTNAKNETSIVESLTIDFPLKDGRTRRMKYTYYNKTADHDRLLKAEMQTFQLVY